MAHDHRPQTASLRVVRPLILASASPRRRALLKALGLSYRLLVPRVRERYAARHPQPQQLVRENARLKATWAARRCAHGVVLAADTLVVAGRRIFGKPANRAAAVRMLRTLSGRTHRVYTGVCVVDVDRARTTLDVAVTRVRMRRLSQADIEAYVRRARPWDKAGAYAVQEAGEMLIDSMNGSLSNVVGLPLDVVERRLRQCGAWPAHS